MEGVKPGLRQGSVVIFMIELRKLMSKEELEKLEDELEKILRGDVTVWLPLSLIAKKNKPDMVVFFRSSLSVRELELALDVLVALLNKSSHLFEVGLPKPLLHAE